MYDSTIIYQYDAFHAFAWPVHSNSQPSELETVLIIVAIFCLWASFVAVEIAKNISEKKAKNGN